MYAAKATGKRQTDSIGLRLDRNDLLRLKLLAAENKESVNTLISQIIDGYLNVWIFDHRYRFFPVSEEFLRLAFDKLSTEEIESLVHTRLAKIHRSMIMQLYGEVSVETVLRYLDLYGKRFETYKHFNKGRRHTITAFHGVCEMFSAAAYSTYSEILGLVGIKIIQSERYTDYGSFAITFELESS